MDKVNCCGLKKKKKKKEERETHTGFIAIQTVTHNFTQMNPRQKYVTTYNSHYTFSIFPHKIIVLHGKTRYNLSSFVCAFTAL